MPTRKRRAEAYRRARSLVSRLAKPDNLDTEMVIYALMPLVRSCGLSLTKLGVSQKYLEDCLATHYLEKARFFLEDIRNPRSADSKRASAWILRDMLKRGDITPDSIGIRDDELTSLGLMPRMADFVVV